MILFRLKKILDFRKIKNKLYNNGCKIDSIAPYNRELAYTLFNKIKTDADTISIVKYIYLAGGRRVTIDVISAIKYYHSDKPNIFNIGQLELIKNYIYTKSSNNYPDDYPELFGLCKCHVPSTYVRNLIDPLLENFILTDLDFCCGFTII